MKVEIYNTGPAFNGIGIIFWDERAGKRYTVKPLNLIMTDHKPGTYAGPTIFLASHEAEEFLKSLAEALDKRGVKTDSDAKIQGTLQATRTHLADMRRLVFNLLHKEGGC